MCQLRGRERRTITYAQIAYRLFRKDRHGLSSLYMHFEPSVIDREGYTRYRLNQTYEAKNKVESHHHASLDSIPTPMNYAGFHAFKSEKEAMNALKQRQNSSFLCIKRDAAKTVIGRVMLGGQSVEYANGWRAQYMRILAILKTDETK